MADANDDNDMIGLGGVGGSATLSQVAIAGSHQGTGGGGNDSTVSSTISAAASDEGDGSKAAQDAVDAAYGRWLAARETLPGWCTYAEAYELVAQTIGTGEQRKVHEQLAEVSMRAHHWHMAPQPVAPSMLFDPVWRWNVARNTVHKATTPDYPEHRLWLEVDREALEERLDAHAIAHLKSRPIPFHVADGTADEATRMAGLEERDRMGMPPPVRAALRYRQRSRQRSQEERDEAPELECRICEAAPSTDMRDLDGLPPGWFALGTLHGRLLAGCGPCKTLLHRALTRKGT